MGLVWGCGVRVGDDREREGSAVGRRRVYEF